MRPTPAKVTGRAWHTQQEEEEDEPNHAAKKAKSEGTASALPSPSSSVELSKPTPIAPAAAAIAPPKVSLRDVLADAAATPAPGAGGGAKLPTIFSGLETVVQRGVDDASRRLITRFWTTFDAQPSHSRPRTCCSMVHPTAMSQWVDGSFSFPISSSCPLDGPWKTRFPAEGNSQRSAVPPQRCAAIGGANEQGRRIVVFLFLVVLPCAWLGFPPTKQPANARA
jgi:hypothetical protein